MKNQNKVSSIANLSEEDKEFLKTYKADEFEHPSVTVDMLIFSVNKEAELQLMLIKRKNSPYKDCWAIPGGFVNIDESVNTAALRELKEETNVYGHLEQFGVFGEVNRDPRTRVISIAYLALVRDDLLKLQMQAGDDAKAVRLFNVTLDKETDDLKFFNSKLNLAFDHEEIIKDGIKELRKRLEYSDIAFHLLNRNRFTLFELQKVWEAITGIHGMAKSNFRRFIKNNYELIETGEMCKAHQRPAKYYMLRKRK